MRQRGVFRSSLVTVLFVSYLERRSLIPSVNVVGVHLGQKVSPLLGSMLYEST
jgi:hypothetical protein